MCALRSIGDGFVRSSIYRFGWALLALMLIGTRANAGAVPIFTLTDLGTLPGTGGSSASGINDSGQVVGYSTGATAQYVFLYSGGTMHALDTVPGRDSRVNAINNSGQVVGSFGTGNTFHAFLYSGTTLRDLGVLGGTNSAAYGINDNGQVVGFSNTGGQFSHAFLYSGGMMHDLGTVEGGGSVAHAINAREQIAGESGGNKNGGLLAVLYSGGTFHDLGNLGGNSSQAFGINASGQVVGASDTTVFTGGASPVTHAFLYTGGMMHDLGVLSEPTGGASRSVSQAYAINDSGEVVGASDTNINSIVGNRRAFLYTNGTMYDLNDLVAGGPGYARVGDRGVVERYGYIITDARGINASGQIVANAITPTGDEHAVLLTPTATTAIPLPPAAWAALTAVPLLLCSKRLRRAIAHG